MAAKPQPRSRPWRVELWAVVHDGEPRWWLLDEFGIESKAVDRMQDIINRGDADPVELRVRFDPNPER